MRSHLGCWMTGYRNGLTAITKCREIIISRNDKNTTEKSDKIGSDLKVEE